MNSVRTAVALLAACAALAACGGGAGQSHPATITSAAQSTAGSPAPPPHAAAWTRQQAASAYLALVAPANAAIKAWNALPPSGGSLAQYTAAAGKVSADLDAQARRLLADSWPADVQPLARDLASKSLRERQYWASVASAPTAADELTAVNDPGFSAAAKDAGAAATAIRIALGLPSN